MNNKLKLANLASPRYTRSMKKKIGEIFNQTTNVSEYFPYNVKKSEPAKAGSKKRPPIKVEYENPPEAKPKKLPKTKRAKPPINDEWEPEHWQSILTNIYEMRKHSTAPVDEMGCHKCSDPNATASDARFQILIALMLSSQTKDQVTHAAMEKLKSHGCTPANIKLTDNEILGKLIYPVSFWKRKVEYIKKTTDILLAQYAGDIPKTIEDLCKLPGVGPKMGHLCMQIAWGEVSGIGVDTHVHRISNRLGWVRKPTKIPEETRVQLESWLPKDKWVEVNYILVGFGQETCLPLRPKCSECLNKNICPYAKKNGAK
ncbi:endonuclease III-like protein 1 [Neodiprion virginianus]|uniref:endonuclease III-like protein 1 n=1 Tax=Neodiprion virginianus TaxID=2961670 RepID=UPI001EE74A2D|nr:endonuclease III-like protein 1 [Neodiprion virginianus]